MARRRRGRPINGWLVIDKSPGMTSADVVSRVRRITGAAKAGHAGTLDPLAGGVLPIALGEATKTMVHVLAAGKSYEFTVAWGIATDTDDVDGTVTETASGRPTERQIRDRLAEFTGWIEQTPPIYSAVKVAGRRAYDLARGGEQPVLEPRSVRIDRFELIRCPDADHAEFRVDCGKGAYMRSLARDLGRRLDSAAHIVALRRTNVGPFAAEGAISLDKLSELCHTTGRFGPLLPVETALADIPALAVTGIQADRLRCGQAIKVLEAGDGPVCVMNGDIPVALATVEAGQVHPVRVFNL